MPSSPTSGGVVQDAAQLFTPLPTQPLVHIAGVPRSDGSQSCLRCLELLPNAAAVPGAYLVLLANERYWPVAMDAWEDSRGLSCQRCRPAENEQIPQLLESPLNIVPVIAPLSNLTMEDIERIGRDFRPQLQVVPDHNMSHKWNHEGIEVCCGDVVYRATWDAIQEMANSYAPHIFMVQVPGKPTLCCRCAVNPAQPSGICVKCED